MPEGYVDDSELWENGTYGQSSEHARPALPEIEEAMNKTMGLTPLNMLLPVELDENLQSLAKENGLAYVAYIRKVLLANVASLRHEE
jgi:hypothetical protein